MSGLSLDEILRGEPETDSGEDGLTGYVEITPLLVSVVALEECKDHLSRSNGRGLRLALAAKAAHLSLQSALIAALAGSANIGALAEKDVAKWLKHFEDSRGNPEAVAPKSDRVMDFDNLLARAQSGSLGYGGQPLAVTHIGVSNLARLKVVRDSIEHPKQLHQFTSPEFIVAGIKEAILHVPTLVGEVSHHLPEGAMEHVRTLCSAIVELLDKVPDAERPPATIHL